jgi:hypothetical protein
MKHIEGILNSGFHSLEDLISCLEYIKNKGDVCIIKMDGQRLKDKYTLLIIFKDENKEMIRVDNDNLISALIEILRLYTNRV